MSTYWVRQNVLACHTQMELQGFKPRTIFDVGSSHGQEVGTFHHFYPEATVVCIDPRMPIKSSALNLPNVVYLQAACGDGSKRTEKFCCLRHCMTTKCRNPDHPIKSVIAVSIDQLALKYPGPYFLWMDTEGSEIDILNGAVKTLDQIGWINTEVRDHLYLPNHAEQIRVWLAAHQYKFVLKQNNTADELYQRCSIG